MFRLGILSQPNRPRMRVMVVSAVAVLLATVAACSSGSKGSATSSTGGSSAASATKHVDLSMWTFLDPNGSDPRGQVLKKVVDGFNTSHPNISVKVTSINYAKIDGQVIRAEAAGSGPDVINIYSAQLAQHVNAGDIQPLDQFAKPWLKQQGSNFIFPMSDVTFNGKVMALPWESRVWLLWYRKDILAKYGVTPPTTLAELRTAGAKIRADSHGSVTGIAIGMSQQGLGADFMEKFDPLIHTYGGQLFTSNGKAAFNSDAGVKALDYIKSLVADGAMGKEVLNMSADDVVNGVKAGTIAMAIEGSFRVAAARAGQGVGANLVTMPVPSDSPGQPTPTAVAGQTLAIGANSKNAAAAWQFIQYYVASQQQAAFAGAGVLPVEKDVYSLPSVTALPNASELSNWKQYLASASFAETYPADYSELSNNLAQAGQKVLFQGQDAKQVLDQVAGAYDSTSHS